MISGDASDTCPLCGPSNSGNPSSSACSGGPSAEAGCTICAACSRTYGPKVARLLARAERDQDFATACLVHLPGPLRERFAALLGQRCLLPGADSRRGPGLRQARPRAAAAWLASAN